MCWRSDEGSRLRPLRLFCCAALVWLFAACSDDREVPFRGQDDDPLAYVPGIEWVLVTEPIAAFRSEASFDAAVTGHARRGDIFGVEGRALVSSKGSDGTRQVTQWFQFEQGWLDQDSVSVYGNRMQAESAAGKIFER